MRRFIVSVPDEITYDKLQAILYDGGGLRGLHNFECPEIIEEQERADGTKRMTISQRDKLWEMCGRYNVPFREDDYYPTQFSKNAPIMYEGWIGGREYSKPTLANSASTTVYVGVEPDGRSHT